MISRRRLMWKGMQDSENVIVFKSHSTRRTISRLYVNALHMLFVKPCGGVAVCVRARRKQTQHQFYIYHWNTQNTQNVLGYYGPTGAKNL